jgi:hypothetical protein
VHDDRDDEIRDDDRVLQRNKTWTQKHHEPTQQATITNNKPTWCTYTAITESKDPKKKKNKKKTKQKQATQGTAQGCEKQYDLHGSTKPKQKRPNKP